MLNGIEYERDGRVLYYVSRNEPPEITKDSWIVSSTLSRSVRDVVN